MSTIPRDRTQSHARLFSVPKEVGFTSSPLNPALPPRKAVKVSSPLKGPATAITETTGYGPDRKYIDIQADPTDIAYPPRPVAGSIADLDVIMDHCDYGTGKVRLSALFSLFSPLLTFETVRS